MINKYLNKLHPEYLITTYEGFPWERQIFKATKEFNNKIKVIGYQQVFLNSNYKSIFLNYQKIMIQILFGHLIIFQKIIFKIKFKK